VPAEHVDEFIHLANGLPNLQLLEGPVNVDKQDKLPLVWAMQTFKEPEKLAHYLASQDLEGLPAGSADFTAFYEVRRQRLAERLRSVLGAVTAD